MTRATTVGALIFDVDGTLADTEEAHRQSFNEAFGVHGLDWHWDAPTYRDLLAITGGKERLAHHIARLHGVDRKPLLALVPAIHATKTDRYTARVAAGGVPLRDGIAGLIDEALTAGARLAIASTTTAANVEALLRATLGERGSALFDAIGCGDVVPAKKPAPDIYCWVLQALELPAGQAVAFEDSEPGLQAATAAGLRTVVTPTRWTAGGDFSQAALVVESAASLTWNELAMMMRTMPCPPVAAPR